MSGKYGMNNIAKSKPETEENFGNNVHQVAPPAPCPPTLRKWMADVQAFSLKAFRDSIGHMEDWRPRGTNDPKAPPANWNKKDVK